MSTLVKYGLTDGAIVAVYTANTEALLLAQIVADDAEYGYLVSDTLVSPFELQMNYQVQDGALTEKPTPPAEEPV